MFYKAIFQLAFISVFLFAFFLSPIQVFAARSITISANKSVLFGYDEMTITIASMSGFVNGETLYIKGAFYKDGSSPNYFGNTKNGNNWTKNGDTTTNQRQIAIGNWDQTIVVKGDFDDSGYINYGEGDYKFKVGFYYLTSGGNPSPVNWSTNSTDIAINNPDPTPTPTSPPPTNTPVPTSTPQPTLSPTHSTGSGSSTPTVTVTAYPTIASISAISTGPGDVLGSSTSGDTELVAGIQNKKEKFPSLLALCLILGGILILGSCGILFFYKWRKNQQNESNNE